MGRWQELSDDDKIKITALSNRKKCFLLYGLLQIYPMFVFSRCKPGDFDQPFDPDSITKPLCCERPSSLPHIFLDRSNTTELKEYFYFVRDWKDQLG